MLDTKGPQPAADATARQALTAMAAQILGLGGDAGDPASGPGGGTGAGGGFFWGSRAEGCRVEDVEGNIYRDLTSAGGTTLLGFNHPTVQEAVRSVCERGLPQAASHALGVEVAWALRGACGGAERVLLTTGTQAALDLAVDLARRRSGRQVLLDVRREPLAGARSVPLAAADATTAASTVLGVGDVAALLLEPIVADAAQAGRLAAIVAAARRAGAAVLCDETQSAFRLPPPEAGAALPGADADVTIVGESVAAGLPFGALLGSAVLLDLAPQARTPAALHGYPVALAAARATLAVLRQEPVAATIARIGERLRTAFVEGCVREQLHGHLLGPPGRMTLSFDAQESASGELIRSVFLEELMRQGIVASSVWMPSPATAEADLQHVESGVRIALCRLRTLMIEHNSWLSGGLRWPFAVREPLLVERGLAVYRYPARAAVDVAPLGQGGPAGMRIAFAAGDLGAVTSSGFYVPTRLRGDFAVRLRYRLVRWAPGAAANLGLFAQDELSLFRYYAQRSSSGGAAPFQPEHRALAHLAERLFPPVPLPGNEGSEGGLALVRQGSVVTSWHRLGDAWVLLGEHHETESRDMIVGCKIWSSGACGGLIAELHDLEIDNDLPTDQIAPVPIRPDPRQTPACAGAPA